MKWLLGLAVVAAVYFGDVVTILLIVAYVALGMESPQQRVG